jgi:V8-like Glu-specific endopeptidase
VAADDEEVEVDPYEIRVVESPLEGRPIRARWIDRAELPKETQPTAVQNWDYYDGAVVGVGILGKGGLRVYGSGVMVAPGVVLTASHIFEGHHDQIASRTEEIRCIGVCQGRRIEMWKAERWRLPETNSDISVLNVRLLTAVPDDWKCACLPITTRAPRDGERLSAVGFTFGAPNRNGRIGTIEGTPIIGQGEMLVSTGAISRLWYPGKDPRISFPTFEIACSTAGGMSGGPVLDETGAIVGLLAAGEETLEEGPRSSVAWILQAFEFALDLPWPPGVYPNMPNLLDLPESLIAIVGRNKVAPAGDQQIIYDYWE